MTSPELDPGNDAATTLPAPDLEGESDYNIVKPWTLLFLNPSWHVNVCPKVVSNVMNSEGRPPL